MKRSTPPSVDFYFDDFVAGTIHMSATQVGMYIRILAFLWGNPAVSADPKILQRITGVYGAEFDENWDDVAKKFVAIEKDEGKKGEVLLVNIRLQAEREKKLRIQERNSENGRKGGRPRKKRSVNSRFPKQNPKGSGSRKKEVSNKKKKESAIPPTLEAVTEFAKSLDSQTVPEAFFDHYESNGWTVGNRKMRSWEAAFRKWHREGWGTSNGQAESQTKGF